MNCCNLFKHDIVTIPEIGNFYSSKVQAKINLDGNNYVSKGYIIAESDSLLCFKFIGPLGYDVGKGRCSDKFYMVDNINNITYPNYFDNIFQNLKIRISTKFLFNFLKGDIDLTINELVKLNTHSVSIEKIGKNSFFIRSNSTIKDENLMCKYVYASNKLKYIEIRSNTKNIFDLKLEIIEISGVKKNCSI